MRLLLVAAAGVVFGLGLGFSAPVLGALAVQAWPATGGHVQRVDRTHKGDRLQIPTTRVGKQPVKAPKILIGCEPAASPLAASTASIPGRCTA